MKIKALVFVFLLSGYTTFSQVTVREDSLNSPSVGMTMKYLVLLPDGYEKSQERYPALYLLHGFGGDYTNWVKQTDLVRYAKQYRFIIVTPDAKNSWYTNSAVNARAKYEDYIMKDLITTIDQRYRTLQSKYHRAIIGLSMGGYGALKLGMKYPSKYFFAAGLSPAIQFPSRLNDTAIVNRRSKESIQSLKDIFGEKQGDSWLANDVFVLAEKAKPNTLPYLYLAVGSQDGIPEIIDETHRFAATLRKLNIPFEMHESPGAHEWRFWDKEIQIILRKIAGQIRMTAQ
ncbi:MAG: alpha/beta hydrolase family protein [bacterium]